MAKQFDPKDLTKEQLEAAFACKTPEELVALAKETGVELTAAKAKEHLEQMADMDISLSDEDMQKVAGGSTPDGYCLYNKW